jgi:hypothetical protein
MKLFGYEFIVRKVDPVRADDLANTMREFKFIQTPLTEAQKLTVAQAFKRHYTNPDNRFH